MYTDPFCFQASTALCIYVIYANSWINTARPNIVWIQSGNPWAVRRWQTGKRMALTAIEGVSQWGVVGCSGSRTTCILLSHRVVIFREKKKFREAQKIRKFWLIPLEFRLFRGTDARNSFPSHSAEGKNVQNSVPNHFIEEENTQNFVILKCSKNNFAEGRNTQNFVPNH